MPSPRRRFETQRGCRQRRYLGFARRGSLSAAERRLDGLEGPRRSQPRPPPSNGYNRRCPPPGWRPVGVRSVTPPYSPLEDTLSAGVVATAVNHRDERLLKNTLGRRTPALTGRGENREPGPLKRDVGQTPHGLTSPSWSARPRPVSGIRRGRQARPHSPSRLSAGHG